MPSSPARTWPTWPRRARWSGCRRASTSTCPTTGRSPAARSATSARRSRWSSATDKYGVVDAAEQVLVEYDPLPVVVDPEAGARGRRADHPRGATARNKVFEWSLGGGDVEAALAGRRRRGRAADRQPPHRGRGDRAARRARRLARGQADALERHADPAHRARDPLDPARASARTRSASSRPRSAAASAPSCRSTARRSSPAGRRASSAGRSSGSATRSEDMATTHHGRDQIDYVRLGAKRDGTLTGDPREDHPGLRLLPPDRGPGDPDVQRLRDERAATTSRPSRRTSSACSRTSSRPTRSAAPGGPRRRTSSRSTMDQLAEELGMDPLELRRKNFITEFPNDQPARLHLRLGQLRRHARQAASRCSTSTRSGASRPSCATAASTAASASRPTWRSAASGPSRALGPEGWGMQGGYFESAPVRVHPTGSVTVYTGTSPHGQGHETGFAQIVADRLGVDPDDRRGDPRRHQHRAVRQGHVRLALAGGRRRGDRPGRREGAGQGEADRRAQARGGAGGHRGQPTAASGCAARPTRADDARRGRRRGLHPRWTSPRAWRPGSTRSASTTRRTSSGPFGAHACVVEVDAETGKVDIVRYIAVDDCGPAINPLLIDGQVHGGDRPRDRPGALRAGRLRRRRPARHRHVRGLRAARARPTCRVFETDRTETPSPTNTLGVKGVGEAGDDRVLAGDRQRRDRRAAAARRHLHRHAADADAGVAGDPGGPGVGRGPGPDGAGQGARRPRERGRRLRTDRAGEGGAA